MITYAILILTVGFSVYAMDRPELKFKYIFHPYSISRFNQHYRFLSHAFLHGSFLHLAFNMYALWIFGPVVEEQILPLLAGPVGEPNKKMGALLYVLLYTGAIYCSSITEYFKNKNNSHYTSLGASGAINALIFSFVVCAPNATMMFLPSWAFGLVYLGISFYLSKRKTNMDSVDQVGHEAHFYGALFGAIFTGVLGLLNQEVFLHFYGK